MKIAASGATIHKGLACLAILLALPGCSEELGPEMMPTAPVAGRVIAQGKPLPGGWLEFLPVEGTVGRLRSARIGTEGTFRADRVARGTVAIRIVGSALPAPYATPFGQVYLIRLEVPPGGEPDLELDLDREYRELTAAPPG